MSQLEASIRENLGPRFKKKQQVHSFEQRQLINMNKYRNIQWKQYLRAVEELEQIIMNNNNNNNNSTNISPTNKTIINNRQQQQ